MPDMPEGEFYKGPCGIARDSIWLTNEDIPHDKDVGVVIESVVMRKNLTMQGGRPKPIGLSLRFVKRERELLLNATNRKTLAILYGNACEGWFGKPILLYVEQDVRRPDGTKGPAVRIRAKRPERASKGDAPVGISADAVPPEALPIG